MFITVSVKMTSGPKAGSRGKGRGEEVKTVRDNITLLTLRKTPLRLLGPQNVHRVKWQMKMRFKKGEVKLLFAKC